MYSFESRIRYSETDRTGRLAIPSLVNYFQDCSNFQSEELGLGHKELMKRGKGWILSSWHIEIYNVPGLRKKVTIGTFATDFNGFYGSRNFVMLDEEGKILACADSTWVLIDIHRGRPIKPDPQDIEPYGVYPPLNLETYGRKVKRIDKTTSLSSFEIQRHQLDTQDHVNNSQYVLMALNVIPKETSVKRLRVEYKKAAVYKDVIVPKVASEEARTVVELCDEKGNPYALVEVSEEVSSNRLELEVNYSLLKTISF
jgi:acyl-ACP thioesterase